MDAQPTTPASRWSLRGDVPWSLLMAAVAGCPWYLESAYNTLCSGIIGACATGQRTALAANLAAMGVPRAGYHAWRSFRMFGSAAIDGLRARAHADVMQWEVQGKQNLDRAEASGLPVVIWTAHMGSYDAAAAFFSRKLGSRMHAVRRPESNPRLQAMREKELRGVEHHQYATIYNDGNEEALALGLLRVLGDGQWVALQADRALPGLSTFTVEDDGLEWLLPKGPFFLPWAAKAMCLPVFVHQTGPRAHRAIIHPPIMPAATRDHRAATLELARTWVKLLRAQVARYPDQWFVYERVVRVAGGHAHD